MNYKNHTIGNTNRSIIAVESAYYNNDTQRLVQFGYRESKNSFNKISEGYKQNIVAIFKIKKRK